MTNIFDDFDFNLLNESEFKEDSVREEIITPILKELGYSSSGHNKIVRSKSLIHPFVQIGTVKRKINIIPDYLLQVDGENVFILDAKAPSENILNGKNVEQAFSYAIHRDIRVSFYALCNGREISIFSINKYEPIDVIKIEELKNEWRRIELKLSPMAFTKPQLFNYKPDFGLAMLKFAMNMDMDFYFYGAWVNSIAKIEDELYSIVSVIKFDEDAFTASFDFNKEQYYDFLDKIPQNWKQLIETALSRMPYYIHFNKQSFVIGIQATYTENVISNDNEDYLPLKVVEFYKTTNNN